MALTFGRRAAVRVAIAAVASGLAAAALAPAASADSWSKHFTVDPCTKPWTQVCQNVRSWNTHYSVPSDVWVTADPTHCSDIIATVRIDGEAMEAYTLKPGQRTAEFRVEPGEHKVSVQAEGIAGGCNRGYLASWGGTVHFQKLAPPGNIDGPNGEG